VLAVRQGLAYKQQGMGDATEETVPPQDLPSKRNKGMWQIVWFLFHLAAVYAAVWLCTPWLAGLTRGRLLPLLQQTTSLSSFEFLYSHIFAFSFIPAFFLGLVASRFRHTAAQFVWLLPTTILVYKFATFQAASVFASQFSAAFHQYFEGGFLIPEVRNWQDIQLMAGSADVTRALAQLKFTAPFYAAVGYSIATWIGLRTNLSQKVSDRVEKWEVSRFGDLREGHGKDT
jgi:hypothetical protein